MSGKSTLTKQRLAEYFQVLFSMLVEKGGSMRRKEVFDEIPKRLVFTPYETSKTAKEHTRWKVALNMWGIDFQKAGFFTRGKGIWTLTEEGRTAFANLSPEELFTEARRRYVAWSDARDEISVDDEPEDDLADDEGTPTPHVWLVGTGTDAKLWNQFRTKNEIRIGFAFDGEQVGDLASLSREEIDDRLRTLTGEPNPSNNQLACWEFGHEMREGELVIARTGFSRVLGVGRITGAYRFDANTADYAHHRSVEWLWTTERRMPERARMPSKTLTDMSPYPEVVDVMLGRRSQRAVDYLGSLQHDSAAIDAYFAAAAALSADSSAARSEPTPLPLHPMRFSDACNVKFPSADVLNSMVEDLERKKALILQGPPGTGKTFIAGRLAAHIAGDASRVMRVQFHPAYSYEEFVRGIRPSTNHFTVVDGPLIELAREAMRRLDQRYVLLIDEFNRANVARVLGEALSLIEADKRDRKHAVRLALPGASLPGGDAHQLWLPPNLYIIGTMNTADRSIALVDHALRRRFAFIDLKPAFDDTAFRPWLEGALAPSGGEQDDAAAARSLARKIQDTMRSLNEKIATSKLLGESHCLGHSYFCGDTAIHDLDLWVRAIFDNEIKPQIREYCADDATLRKQLLDLASAFDQ